MTVRNTELLWVTFGNNQVVSSFKDIQTVFPEHSLKFKYS